MHHGLSVPQTGVGNYGEPTGRETAKRGALQSRRTTRVMLKEYHAGWEKPSMMRADAPPQAAKCRASIIRLPSRRLFR